MSNWKIHKKNALAVVAQFERGEWEFRWNSLSRKCLTAQRGEHTLWLGNGPWYIEMHEPQNDCFGLFWRHYVWHKIKDYKKGAEAVYRGADDDVPMRLWEATHD